MLTSFFRRVADCSVPVQPGAAAAAPGVAGPGLVSTGARSQLGSPAPLGPGAVVLPVADWLNSVELDSESVVSPSVAESDEM